MHKAIGGDQHKIDYLLKFRIVQENLLYVIGIPQSIASEQLLQSDRFFGAFGQIKKLLINRSIGSRESQYEGQCAVYVWYAHSIQVALALKVIKNLNKINCFILQCLNGLKLGDHYNLKCSFGTSKYCSNFLSYGYCESQGENGKTCPFLHYL
jgi:CCR4-NOT transcription complex subunit 4